MNRTIVIDFDLTLTLTHTYPVFSILKRGRKIPTPDYSDVTTDEEIFKNLRNPYAMRYLISWLIKNQDEVLIVSKHDNKPWIQRNLDLLMGSENAGLVKLIKVIPLQVGPYDIYGGSKLGAIKGESSKKSSDYIVIDDDEKELKKLQDFTHNLIQVKPDSDDYLGRIEFHCNDKFSSTCLELARYKDQREKRTSSEYYYGFFSKFFGGYSKQDKFAAVDALIDSISDTKQFLSFEHIKFLKQGKLGELVKKLNIDLDRLIDQRPESEKLIRIKNGAFLPEGLVEVTISALHTLKKENNDLFSALVRKCRSPEDEIGAVDSRKLILRHFMTNSNTINRSISDIILSAVEGENSNLTIGSPIETSSKAFNPNG